ncbi:hypothetical protein SAMN04515647_3698 [Cohaesibacter sp. ES.047]|nr:hypothetical protein SAMN04515647_3698 [Cohaesibacter sp. ES.047]
MFCPEMIVFDSNFVMVILHTSADYPSWKCIPARKKFNPLRYSLCFWPGPKRRYINKNGRAAFHVSNFIFRLKRKIRGEADA